MPYLLSWKVIVIMHQILRCSYIIQHHTHNIWITRSMLNHAVNTSQASLSTYSTYAKGLNWAYPWTCIGVSQQSWIAPMQVWDKFMLNSFYRWLSAKKDVTPLLTHWSYVFLALSHQYKATNLTCHHASLGACPGWLLNTSIILIHLYHNPYSSEKILEILRCYYIIQHHTPRYQLLLIYTSLEPCSCYKLHNS